MNEEQINLNIGEKIRTRRKELGINQTDLGSKIDVTFQQVQKYEKGQNKISASKLYDLSRKMEVPISYFFERANNNLSIAENAMNEESAEFIHKSNEESKSRETITLVKLYNNISNHSTRKKLLSFLKTLNEEE